MRSTTTGSDDKVAEDIIRALQITLDQLEDEKRAAHLETLRKAFDAALERYGNVEKGRANPVTVTLKPDLAWMLIPRIGNSLSDFLVYSPENSALRTFAREGQVEPLGTNGEGLLKLLKVMARDDPAGLDRVRAALKMLVWFEDLRLAEGDAGTRLDIVDKFLDPNAGPFDQSSANEGFLFITFFFALFSSALTPRFFAVDNIDASLNPRLCQAMTEQLAALARASDKQVLLTTHQPAILDGLDLNDDEQRLFVVSRTTKGRTKIKRFRKPPPGGFPRRLSELFLEGAIGGIPKGL